MTHTSDAIADHDVYAPYTNDLTRYIKVWQSNTLIADSMAYTNLPADLRQRIWEKFDEAETNSGVLDLTNPADLPADQHAPNTGPAQTARVVLTRPEALESYSSKVAHAFWLEVSRVYPWSILSYTLEECQHLFAPANLYWTWDIDGATPAQLQAVCDHSPKRAYDHTAPLLTSPRNRKAAILQLVRHGGDFAHSNPSTSLAGWSPNSQSELALSMDQVTQPGTANVGNNYSTSSSSFISRSGCHFMGHYQPALARAVNIPCADVHGLFAESGPGAYMVRPSAGGSHHTCWWPGVNQTRRRLFTADSQGTEKGLVLSHGDDTYFLKTYEGPAEGVVERRLTNRAYYITNADGKTWQEQHRAGLRANNSWRMGHNPNDEPSNFYDLGWVHAASPIIKFLNADEIADAVELRQSFEGKLGLLPDYDYTKMVWPVSTDASRREQTLTTGGTLDVPTNLVDGDLMVFAFAGKNTVTTTNVMPAGFTHVTGSPFTSCGTSVLIVGYKVASSEGATISYGPTTPGTEHSAAMLMAFRNVDQATPIGTVATGCDVSTALKVYVDAPLIAPSDEDEFFQLTVLGKDDTDLAAAFLSAEGASTDAPYMPWFFDYFYPDQPGVNASVAAACGARGPTEKTNATGLWMKETRTSAGMPMMSIQLRRAS